MAITAHTSLTRLTRVVTVRKWSAAHRPVTRLGQCTVAHPAQQSAAEGESPNLNDAQYSDLHNERDPTIQLYPQHSVNEQKSDQSHSLCMVRTPHPSSKSHKQQLHAWTVFKQCVWLAAAATAATPFILVLDIAERACLALCHVQQMRRLTVAHNSNVPAGKAQQRSQHDTYAAGANGRTGRDSRTTSPSSFPSSRVRVSSTARPLLLDVLPPWTAMASVIVPLLVLIVRHWSNPLVLKCLLWCGASLVGQSYLSLLLVMLQRLGNPAASANYSANAGNESRQTNNTEAHKEKTAGACLDSTNGTGNSCTGSVSSHGWWTASVSSLPDSRHTCVDGTRDSSSSRNRSQRSSRWLWDMAGALVSILHTAGDIFRALCLLSACLMILKWHVHLTAGSYAACAWALQYVLDSINVVTSGQLAGYAVAAALKLHGCMSSTLWLGVDLALCAAGVGVFVLAAAGRVLPGMVSR